MDKSFVKWAPGRLINVTVGEYGHSDVHEENDFNILTIVIIL